MKFLLLLLTFSKLLDMKKPFLWDNIQLFRLVRSASFRKGLISDNLNKKCGIFVTIKKMVFRTKWKFYEIRPANRCGFMARRLFTIIFVLCCFVTDALATRNKGVPLEYASAMFVLEGTDTLHLEIRTADHGMLNLVQLTGKNMRFSASDSIIHFFRQFMIHGFEIGAKPKKNGGGIYIHLLSPTNNEGFAIVVDDKGPASIEKVLTAFVRKKGEAVKLKDYKPKKNYSNDGKLKILSIHLVYDLGMVLGKMEINADSKSDSLKVNAFNRVDEIELKEKVEDIISFSLYELKQNNLYLLKLPNESVRLPVAK